MTSVYITVCLLIFICIGFSAEELSCGPNQYVDNCPKNCSYDYCPTDELQDKTPCPDPATCPPPACKCIFNYRRAANGTCIRTEDCPPFTCSRPNEIYMPCPSYCPGEDCSDANPTGECPYISLLVVNCSPACRCIPHNWRKNGVCVPYAECPAVSK